MFNKRKTIYKTIFAVGSNCEKYEIFHEVRQESYGGQCTQIDVRYGDKEGQYCQDTNYGCSSRGDDVISIEDYDLEKLINEGMCSFDLKLALDACNLNEDIEMFILHRTVLEIDEGELNLHVVQRDIRAEMDEDDIFCNSNPIPEDKPIVNTSLFKEVASV